MIQPSTFDAESATPVLLEWLPRVCDARLTLQAVMTPEHHDALLPPAEDRRYGASRQMLIDALWRVKLNRAEQVLTSALAYPAAALHAGLALRRMIGNERAIDRLAGLVEVEDERVARAARRNLKLAQKALERKRNK